MNYEVSNVSAVRVPEIVYIVLTEAEKCRRAGTLTQEQFDGQMCRLMKEELQPRRLTLLIRELGDGRTRFIIKLLDTGRVCDMLESAALPAPLAPSRGAG